MTPDAMMVVQGVAARHHRSIDASPVPAASPSPARPTFHTTYPLLSSCLSSFIAMQEPYPPRPLRACASRTGRHQGRHRPHPPNRRCVHMYRVALDWIGHGMPSLDHRLLPSPALQCRAPSANIILRIMSSSKRNSNPTPSQALPSQATSTAWSASPRTRHWRRRWATSASSGPSCPTTCRWPARARPSCI